MTAFFDDVPSKDSLDLLDSLDSLESLFYSTMQC